jgi:hypothetical protein
MTRTVDTTELAVSAVDRSPTMPALALALFTDGLVSGVHQPQEQSRSERASRIDNDLDRLHVHPFRRTSSVIPPSCTI